MATRLEEALTAVGASALIQKRIDRNLLEYQRRYAPLVRSTPTVKWDSNVYYFNKRTVLPAGGFVTDGGARPVTTSTYTQEFYPIKQLQAVGAVTGYAQAVTADLIGSLRAKEIMGAAKGLYWDIETAMCWGNAAATLGGPYPQYDGLDTIASVFSGDNTNAIDWNGGNASLGALDQLIDLVEQNVAEDVCNSDWMFVLSTTFVSRLAQLFTNQQRFVDEVEVATGLIVPSYRNIPLVKTSFLSPRGASMPTISAAASGSGALTGTYYYKVSPVISRMGEALASNETSAAPSSQIVTISFTPSTGFEGATPQLYKVFRSTGSGTETFLGYVDANVGLQADGVTPIVANQIVDNGVTLIPQNSTGPTQPATYPAAYVGTNTDIKPLSAGEQNAYLVSRNSDYVVRPYVREMIPVDVYPTTASPDSLPFAFQSDCTYAVRAARYLGRLANVVVELSS